MQQLREQLKDIKIQKQNEANRENQMRTQAVTTRVATSPIQPYYSPKKREILINHTGHRRAETKPELCYEGGQDHIPISGVTNWNDIQYRTQRAPMAPQLAVNAPMAPQYNSFLNHRQSQHSHDSRGRYEMESKQIIANLERIHKEEMDQLKYSHQ